MKKLLFFALTALIGQSIAATPSASHRGVVVPTGPSGQKINFRAAFIDADCAERQTVLGELRRYKNAVAMQPLTFLWARRRRTTLEALVVLIGVSALVTLDHMVVALTEKCLRLSSDNALVHYGISQTIPYIIFNTMCSIATKQPLTSNVNKKFIKIQALEGLTLFILEKLYFKNARSSIKSSIACRATAVLPLVVYGFRRHINTYLQSYARSVLQASAPYNDLWYKLMQLSKIKVDVDGCE